MWFLKKFFKWAKNKDNSLKESKENISTSEEIGKVLIDKENIMADDKKVEDTYLPTVKENLRENKDDDKIKDKTKKEIDKLLNSSDLDQVKYLFLKLFQLYFWSIPKIEINWEDSIKFILEWFNFKKYIKDFYLDIIENYQEEENIIYKYWELNFQDHNFNLSIDDYTKSSYILSLTLTWKLKEKDILFLKWLVEQYLLSNNFLEKERVDFDINKMKEWLKELENIDISISQDKLNIVFKNKLDKKTFDWVFAKIIDETRNYYIGIDNYILRENINIIYKSLTSGIKEFSFTRWFNEEKFYISLPTKIDPIFWNDIIYPLIKDLSTFTDEEDEKSIIENLKTIWTVIELPDDKNKNFDDILKDKWFVWYEDILDNIETNIILPWKDKENYIKKAKEISPKLVKDILPNAVLFYGAPWTWKTTISSAIWNYLNYPFVYLPVQKIMSKWYGESEQKLDYIFENVWKLWKIHNWVVLMIDEIDEIWKNREKTHEATAKLTGILLKKLDGLERLDNLLLIWATNLKDSLDDALLSRFSEDLEFRLPNKEEIKKIFNFYIPGIEITDDMIKKLEKVSWRDIRNTAKQLSKLAIKENKEVNDIVVDYFNKM